ncbi:MAG TPA: hypothetical protein VMA09_04355 [Candidatus Binataceae bacterium]|nr:hypothetical protein [Candidatus Binataceae bacterium]
MSANVHAAGGPSRAEVIANLRYEPVAVVGTATGVVGAILVVLGVIGFAMGIMRGDAATVWEAYLVGLLYFTGVAQGAMVASAAYYLTQARWAGTTQYRLAEAFLPFLWVGFALFWGLFFGRAVIFPWVLHPIAHKAAYLNTPFLFLRDGLGFFLLALMSTILVRFSRGDKARMWILSPETIDFPPPIIWRVGPALAIGYVFIYSMFGIDLVMSLAPVWRSTLFGWFFLAGAFWSGVVAMAFCAVLLRGRLKPGNTFTKPKVLHDLGKFVFAFSVFWVYLLFSQYIVIWYGDLPVETFFIVQRVHHMPWSPLSLACAIMIFVIPFIVLMSVKAKQTPAILGGVAFVGLIGMWLERYVLVVPSLSLDAIPFGLTQLLITLGFLGAFILCAIPGLNRVATAASAGEPVGDDE